MRKATEIIMVIAAAGLAAAAALFELPTRSADPGTVVAGGSLSAAPPSASVPALPPLPPLLPLPFSSTAVPVEPVATPAPLLALGVQPQDLTEASSPAMGVLGTSLVQPAATPATKAKPPATKTKPPVTNAKSSSATKAKPPPATKAKPPATKAKSSSATKAKSSSAAKAKPPPTRKKPKSVSKPKGSRKATSAGPSVVHRLSG